MKKIFLLFFFILSCATIDQVKLDQDFHKVITLERIEVHIVSDRTKFNLKNVLVLEKDLRAYAKKSGKIYVIAKKVNGYFIIDYHVLGHELAHLMSWKDPQIPDPDKAVIPAVVRLRRRRKRREDEDVTKVKTR